MDCRKVDESNNIGRLAALLNDVRDREPPPVERWDPPYCGDIRLKICADGTWVYRDSPIRREGLIKLFASVLSKDVDGRTHLVTLAEKVDVEVEDAPFLAVEMEVYGSGTGQELIFRTNVDDIVRCGPEHPLQFSVQERRGGLKPYLHVRGRLEAFVTRALCYDLVALTAEVKRGGQPVLGLWSGGKFIALHADGHVESARS
ncbi:MAG: DUF1285 domain-containing protein [Hyphomicrobium sp.]|nr:DUF1285 domain-containing protein [Hyphomicrobium sp.]